MLSKRQSRTMSIELLDRRAEEVRDRRLCAKAFDALSSYTQTKAATHNLLVQARTHYNIQVKQKVFEDLRLRARSRVQSREAIEVFRALQAQAIKRRVLNGLRDRKDEGNHKMLQHDIAMEQYRKHRLSVIFGVLRKRAKCSDNGEQLRQYWQEQRVHTHFKAWLAATNSRIEQRVGGTSSRLEAEPIDEQSSEAESLVDHHEGARGRGF